MNDESLEAQLVQPLLQIREIINSRYENWNFHVANRWTGDGEEYIVNVNGVSVGFSVTVTPEKATA